MSAAFALATKKPALDAQTMPALIVLDCNIALRACAKTPRKMLLMERRIFSFLMGVWFYFHLLSHGTETRDRRSFALFYFGAYMSVKPNPGVNNGLSRKKTGLFRQKRKMTLFVVARLHFGRSVDFPDQQNDFFPQAIQSARIHPMCELFEGIYGSRHPKLRTFHPPFICRLGCQDYPPRASGSGSGLGSGRFSF